MNKLYTISGILQIVHLQPFADMEDFEFPIQRSSVHFDRSLGKQSIRMLVHRDNDHLRSYLVALRVLFVDGYGISIAKLFQEFESSVGLSAKSL